MDTIALTVDEIHELARACLLANGCDEANDGCLDQDHREQLPTRESQGPQHADQAATL